MKQKDKVQIKIHRGASEIGGNTVEIISGTSRIAIDIGMPLTLNDKKFDFQKYKNLTGPELVANKILPDVKGLYVWEQTSNRPDGVLISHPHIDHYGFSGYIHPDNTVYTGEAAKKLMDITAMFSSIEPWNGKTSHFRSGNFFTIGPFKIKPYLMDHSGFDSYAFLIETAGKKILYSGDFRGSGRKVKAFRWFLLNCPTDIDAVILEGTMMGCRQNEETKDEEDISKEAAIAMENTEGITLINCSSQNIDRIVSFFKSAYSSGRTLVVDLYTAIILEAIRVHAQTPYPSHHYNIRVFYPPHICNKLVELNRKDLIYKFRRYKISKSEIIANQSKIAMLVRPSLLKYLPLAKSPKGLFIYSLWDGYLKEKSGRELLEYVSRHEMDFTRIHTSGHAGIKDMKALINNLKPRTIIPIHTTSPENYKILGNNITVLKNGETLNI